MGAQRGSCVFLELNNLSLNETCVPVSVCVCVCLCGTVKQVRVDRERIIQHIYIIAKHCAKQHFGEMKDLVPLNRYSHCFSSLIQLEQSTERSDVPSSQHTHLHLISSVFSLVRAEE